MSAAKPRERWEIVCAVHTRAGFTSEASAVRSVEAIIALGACDLTHEVRRAPSPKKEKP